MFLFYLANPRILYDSFHHFPEQRQLKKEARFMVWMGCLSDGESKQFEELVTYWIIATTVLLHHPGFE
jgi:hypothetical protein